MIGPTNYLTLLWTNYLSNSFASRGRLQELEGFEKIFASCEWHGVNYDVKCCVEA